MSDNDNEDHEDLTRPILPSISAFQSYVTLEGDIEDASWEKSMWTYLVGGEKFVSKLAALHQLLLDRSPLPIQKASCFNLSAPALLSARGNMVHDSDLGEPCVYGLEIW